jgi:hypothetical protein
MAVTLSELLALVGPLDDATGYETPRERYRRFINEHLATPAVLRGFIDDCQHTLDDQQHRALLDLVVLAGRFLGFEPRFGVYAPAADTPANEVSQWRSRTGFDVLVDIRTGLTTGTDVEDLSRSVFSRQDLGVSRALGIAVTTPLFPRRNALDLSVIATGAPIRVVSLRALMSLVDLAEAHVLDHDDVIKTLRSSQSLDGVVDLLQRVARRTPVTIPAVATPIRAHPEPATTGFWLATVAGEPGITAEQFLERVVGKRHIFGVRGTAEGAAATGDCLAFYVKDKGVMGRAQVSGTLTDSRALRDAHQYGQILKLTDIALHVDCPAPVDAEAQLRLLAAGGVPDASPALRRITEQEFEAITADRPGAAESPLHAVPSRADDERREGAEIEPLIARSPRSRG